MFGLFTQVLDNISGCTDGVSNTGLWVWLLCLFTSSWYKSYPNRQTGKLWSATLGLILKHVKGLEKPLESPWAFPAFLNWVIFIWHGHFIHLLPNASCCCCWTRGIWDVTCQGWSDVVCFGLWQPHTLSPACPCELCINTHFFPHLFCNSVYQDEWDRFLCVRESQINEFMQIKTQHLHRQLTFGRYLSFGAARLERGIKSKF